MLEAVVRQGQHHQSKTLYSKACQPYCHGQPQTFPFICRVVSHEESAATVTTEQQACLNARILLLFLARPTTLSHSE